LIIMGALFGLMGATEAKDAAWKAQWLKPMVGCFGFSGWSESLNFLVVACLHLGWCAVLVPIFGRDFARCLRRVPGVVEPRSC
jgi:hypothetical protein